MRGQFDLTGRTALITGSSRGIGAALARGLGEAGATLVLHGREGAALEIARREAAERFGHERVHAFAFDVTDEPAVETAVASIEETIGPLDILVNNAGIQHRVAMLDLDLEHWETVIRTDLTAAFIVGRAVARRMIPRGAGKIVNICSVQADLARPTIAPYTAAKGGLRNLTRAMTAEWAASGLQINGLAPGYIKTRMTEALVADPEFDGWVRRRTPAGRWGQPDELAGPLVWLASSASDFVNGQVIFVDGGMTAVV